MRRALAHISTLGLSSVLAWRLFSSLDAWGADAFATPIMASALVSALQAVAMVAVLAVSPALSRLFALVFRVPFTPTTPGDPRPWSRLAVLAALAAALAVPALEWLAIARSDDPLSLSLTGGVVLLASALGLALPIAAALGLLVALGRVEGPATAWSTGWLGAWARAPLRGQVIGAAVGLVLLGGGTALRVELFGRPDLAGAVDLLFWAAALAAAGFVAPRVGGRVAPPRVAWGLTIVGLTVLGAAVGSSLRGAFSPSGLWAVALVGVYGALVLGLLLALPARFGHRGPVIGALVAAVACAVAVPIALDRDTALREGLHPGWRPVVWIVEAGMRVVDADKDGYSPIFGGGDCDDSNPMARPDGLEIVGNGVDEDCIAGDAQSPDPWAPRPTFVDLPAGFQKPRGVVLIMVDTLRRDVMGYHGYHRPTTPYLDRFAATAARFDRAYSTAPSTSLAVPTLFVGRTLGGVAWDRSRHPYAMHDRNVTLAEVMRDAGFDTAAFVAHRYLGPDWKFMQGFEHLDTRQVFPKSQYRSKVTGRSITRATLDWIGDRRDGRFLAFAHYFDPHDSYVAHPDGPDFGRRQRDLYDGEVRYTDQVIGELIDGLAEMGIAETTAVVFLSDHGEFFGEHGLRFHGGSLREEGAAIPLLIRVPGLDPQVVPCVTPHNDIAPTVLNLVGIDGAAHGMTAASLVPELTGRGCDAKRETVLELRYDRRGQRNKRALVGPRWKLEHDLRASRYRLVDLESPRGEAQDVRATYPERLGEMSERLARWSARYVNQELVSLLQEVTIDALPAGVRSLSVRFANGLELVGSDFGSRRLDVDNPIFARLFFRAPHSIDAGQCRVRYDLVRIAGKRKGKSLYGEAHTPLSGLLDVRFWPQKRIVIDHFEIQKRRRLKKLGRHDLRLSMTCDGEPVGIEDGVVDDEGRLRLGYITVRRSKRSKAKKTGKGGRAAKSGKAGTGKKAKPGERRPRQIKARPDEPAAGLGPVGPTIQRARYLERTAGAARRPKRGAQKPPRVRPGPAPNLLPRSALPRPGQNRPKPPPRDDDRPGAKPKP